jgi:hypothetical protein
MMSADDKKTKNTAPKKEPAAESKTAEAAPKTEAAPKIEAAKAEGVKSDAAKTEAAKPDAAPAKQGMGEGQKRVSQAYKDNWNAIFAKKKKKR